MISTPGRSKCATAWENRFFTVSGFVLVLAGIYILFVNSSVHSGTWWFSGLSWPWLWFCGSVFPVAGIVGLVTGTMGTIRRKQKHEPDAQVLHARWYADYPWRDDGARDDAFSRLGKYFASGVIIFAFWVPFHCFASPFLFFALFGDLFLAVVGAWHLCVLIQYLRFGICSLRFSHFPFFLGEELAAEIVNAQGITESLEIEISLLCIKERTEKAGGSRRTVFSELHSDRKRLIRGTDYREGDRGIPVRFSVPADAPSTNFAESSAVYWEIRVHAKRRGPDYRGVFLVPVYGKPS